MQFVPDADEKIVGSSQQSKIFFGHQSEFDQSHQIGFAVLSEAHPADRLDIAQPPVGSFDVGTQQIRCPAPFAAFFAADAMDQTDQLVATPDRSAAEAFEKPSVQTQTAGEVPRFGQRRVNLGIGPRQPARLAAAP